MSLYARINPDTQLPEVRELATPPSAAKGWLPLVIDAKPIPSATQVLVDAGIVFEPTQARQTWALRDKTAAELEADALASEKAQLDADIAAINVQLDITNALYNAMTNAQKFDTLRDDRRLVLKAIKYLLRHAKRSF